MSVQVESSVVGDFSIVEPACCNEDDSVLLKALNEKTYKEQAIWFLNAFWKAGPAFGENSEETERIWEICFTCIELDSRGADGNELNEFDAHRLLEKVDTALTVREMREVLKEIDIDFNRYMSLTEFLVYKYRVNWRELVHAPQGGVDEAKLVLAQKKVDDAKNYIQVSELRAGEAKISEKECVHIEMQAKTKESEAIEAEASAQAAEEVAAASEAKSKKAEEDAIANESSAFREESLAKDAEKKAIAAEEEHKNIEKQLKEALECLHREETAFHDKCTLLEQTSQDEGKGIVTRNTAKAELAQLRSSDPMPLQRAKISQEAVVRRQERSTKSAAATKIAAQSARTSSEESRKKAVESRQAATEASCSATARKRNAETHMKTAKEARQKAASTREEAEASRRHAEKFRVAAEEALAKSVESFQEATRFLTKVKQECQGVGKGKIWWMNRELEEAKKYMSRAQLARLEAVPMDPRTASG